MDRLLFFHALLHIVLSCRPRSNFFKPLLQESDSLGSNAVVLLNFSELGDIFTLIRFIFTTNECPAVTNYMFR